MVKSRKSKTRRCNTKGKKNDAIFNKIDLLLIILMKKLKQDQNNKEFYINSFESVIKEIHNFKTKVGVTTRGGGNLKSTIYKLFVLVMSLGTTLSSSVIPYKKFVNSHDTGELDTVGEMPSFDRFLFYTEHENLLRFKTNNYISSTIDSLNKQYITTIANGKSELSSAAKITNMCRDVFLRSSVQKLLVPTQKQTSYTFTSTIFIPETPVIDTTDVDYNSLCELSFPIPRFVVDDRDKTIKIEITKSIGYDKIADMLEILYESIDNDKVDDEVQLKIQKLKYLIKGVRHIEDSAKENSDLLTKFHNIHERISNYFNTFKNIENMVGDPELHFGSIQKGLKNAFDTNLINQETKQNEILSKARINSYILPFFSGVSTVTDSSIEYFSNSVNNIITGLNIDTYLFNLIALVLGTTVLCVGISSCSNQRNKAICDNLDINSLHEEFIMLRQTIKEVQDNQIKVHHISDKQENFTLPKTKLPRCPKGERRNKKTLKCTPHKIGLRTADNVIYDYDKSRS